MTQRRLAQQTPGQRHAGLAAAGRRDRRCAARCATSTPIAASPGPYGSNPAGSVPGRRHASRAARHRAARRVGARLMQPLGRARPAASACGSTPTPPTTTFDFRSAVRAHVDQPDAAHHGRGQTDASPSARLRRLGRRRVARRARAQHLHHRRARAEVPVERQRRRHVRRGAAGPGRARDADRRRARRAHHARRARRRPDRRSRRGRRSPDDDVTSVNPKLAAAWRGGWRRRRGGAAAGRGCTPRPAPASGRPTRSRSRSPTTRR